MELGKQVIGLNPDALTFLQKYSWPYNLKQLQKILRELIFLTDSSYISAHDTSMILQRESPHITNLTDTAPKFNLDLSKTLHEITHDIVHIVLTEENMNLSLIHISEPTRH